MSDESSKPAEESAKGADDDEARAIFREADDENADLEAIEPELIESKPRPGSGRPHALHPPPPPSLRAIGAPGPDAAAAVRAAAARFAVTGNPKLAGELMVRKVLTIGPDDPLEHLEEHMQAFRFRHLPVIDGDKLVGLISRSDLLHASSSFLSDRAKERDEVIHKLPARRIMKTELVTIGPDAPLTEVSKLMWEKRVGCVLVVEDKDTLVGIITEADFVRLAHHLLVASA